MNCGNASYFASSLRLLSVDFGIIHFASALSRYLLRRRVRPIDRAALASILTLQFRHMAMSELFLD
jgi:hypothetical protein